MFHMCHILYPVCVLCDRCDTFALLSCFSLAHVARQAQLLRRMPRYFSGRCQCFGGRAFAASIGLCAWRIERCCKQWSACGFLVSSRVFSGKQFKTLLVSLLVLLCRTRLSRTCLTSMTFYHFWLSIPFPQYSWPLTPVLNSLYQLFRANYLTQVMSLKGSLSKNVCVCVSAKVSCQDCLPDNPKSISPRVSVKECLSVLPRVSLQECLPKSVSQGLSCQECLSRSVSPNCVSKSVSPRMFLQERLSKVVLSRRCLAESVSEGASLQDCRSRNVLWSRVSSRVSLQECLVKSVPARVCVRVSFKDSLSRSVSARCFDMFVINIRVSIRARRVAPCFCYS